jgi:malate dehydrogenase (oxaloacetate-decarboxylating)
MMETDTFVNQAVAVGLKAIEQGIARRILSEAELRAEAELRIRRAQNETALLQREGLIAPPPA